MIRIWFSQVKGGGHHITKYGQKLGFKAINPIKYTKPQLYSDIPDSNFCQSKNLLGQCWAFLKIWGPKLKGQVHHMTKISKITVLYL